MTLKHLFTRTRRIERAMSRNGTQTLVVTVRTAGEDTPLAIAEAGQHRFHRNPDETEAAFRERVLASLADQDGPIRLAIFLPNIDTPDHEETEA
ncbi:MAG: hypothetical protein M0006_05365 [Magnetospirillum sp.]|nr:hypothetical protein [Magnetospirillum sp.]